MKQAPQINSFNAGQFSPLMVGRTDLKQYRNACRRIRNFIPTVQGPARRRPGTRFIAEVKTSANRTWLHKFRFNTDQVYVLEFGNLYIRFFANDGVVGGPLEVVTPYATADLTDVDGTFRLRFVQSGDVVFIFHPKFPTQKLSRTGAAAFNIAAVDFKSGPFRDINPNNTITIGANVNGPGAGIALVASAPVFIPNAGNPNQLIGKKIRLEQRSIDNIKQWEPGKAVVVGNVRRSDGKNYSAQTGGNTGTVKPIHSNGQKWDGDAGVLWQFDDPGYGYGVITAIADSTHATCTGITRFPDGCITAGLGPTTRWAIETFIPDDGYPGDGTFFRERLCMMRGRDVFGSVAGDFENMADRDDGGIITADMAFRATTLSNSSDDINWIMPSNKALLFGTKADEQVMMEMNTTEPFGPGNIATHKQSENGARNVAPEGVSDGVIFVQRNGRRVREMRSAESVDERWESIDLTVLADDVTRGGIIQMAYQQDPDSVVWCCTGDGRLIGLTINRENDVRGWHEHRIGGVVDILGNYAEVESVVTIPGPNQDRDELWMIVRRWVNGAQKRYIEVLDAHHDRFLNPFDQFYVDCGLSLNSYQADTLTVPAFAAVRGSINQVFQRGAANWNGADVGRRIHYYYTTVDAEGTVNWKRGSALITEFTDATHVKCTILEEFPLPGVMAAGTWNMTVSAVVGMGHLQGETVQIIADGETFNTVVPGGGTINISKQASKVSVGFACPAVLQPMPIETQGAIGSTMTKTKRTNRVGIRFEESRGVMYGRDELSDELDTIPDDENRFMFTGDVVVAFPDGYDGQQLITIVQDKPYACTVIGIVPDIDTAEDR